VDFRTVGGTLTQNYLGRHLAGNEYETVLTIAAQAGNTEGVAFGADGTVWLGDRSGFHATGYDPGDQSFLEIYETPHGENDTLNVFPGRGNMLSIAGAPDGTVYISQYAGGGVIKYNAATTGHTDLMEPGNSGLQGRSIINLAVHPDGPLMVMHDWVDAQKVEILVDPDNWSSPTSWYLPPMAEGLGLGPSVWDALVERPDIIWFAVEDAGLVCWDINGPLTWFDETDDVWYDPIGFFPGTTLDPGKVLGLAMGRDGSIWAGGNGLVQFTYEIVGSTTLSLDVHQDFIEKSPATPEGLVNGNVKDVGVDKNGDVWVATRTGLNRLSPQGDEYLISAWIDLGNYLGNPNYQLIYSPNVIAPLPGITYGRMAVSSDGRQLALSADQGSTLITVGSGTGTESGSEPLASVFCYPNPWTPGVDADLLSLGGLPTETAAVSVYNLEGQLVYVDNLVADQTGFWDGTNSKGSKVATGLYYLTIAIEGTITTRTVAVVR
jgi:streptogramin lyase